MPGLKICYFLSLRSQLWLVGEPSGREIPAQSKTQLSEDWSGLLSCPLVLLLLELRAGWPFVACPQHVFS